ncbi:MAG: NEW3 domain-containing protein [Chloroflexi bacterium]|nr:NEW3 domain-containing protein [Chloroflexota bacterium]
MRIGRLLLVLTTLAFAFGLLSATAYAQEPSDVRLDSAVRSLEMGPRETRTDLTVDLYNTTSDRRVVRIELEDIPDGWDIAVWDRFFDFKIGEIVVEPPAADDTGPSQSLRLRVDLPDVRPPSGSYSFGLRITSPDGSIEYDSARYTIMVPEPPASTDSGVAITVTYPALSGPSTSEFEFEIVIDNDTGADTSFNLTAAALDQSGQVLPGWDITFSPSFGQERVISSISVGDALNERVDVRVTPPRNTAPGDYLIPVQVQDDAGFEADALLLVTIRGRGEVFLGTDTGLLNLDATAGEEASTKLRLTNFGTGNLAGIGLLADAPSGWEINFEVDSVADLPVNNQIDITTTVLPAADAIPGDYLVTLRANHPDTNASLELRVTVAQSTIWGWLGIVLVVLVIVILGALFVRLGRR